MRKMTWLVGALFGTSLLAGIGIFAVTSIVSPSQAEAGCYTRWVKQRKCYRRYGRVRCVTRRYSKQICSRRYRHYRRRYRRSMYRRRARCWWKTYTKRKCYRTRGYYVRRRVLDVHVGYVFVKQWVPGTTKCSYPTYRKRVCNY